MFRQSLFSTIRVATRRQFAFRRAGMYAAGAAAVGCGTFMALNNQSFIQLDAASTIKTPPSVSLIQPETKVNPFPTEFSYKNEGYSLLGTGVRSVSFLGINVYAVGIYIAAQDKHKIKQVLDGATEEQLMDPETGSELISKLLNSNVKLDIRIVPVRNTDVGHLRDGIVRKIMQHPRFKQEGNNEEFGEGLQELKRVFGRKMSVPKNKVLHMNRDRDGTMTVDFFKADCEDDIAAIELGTVSNKLVTEFLFLQYLSGKDPSSPSCRASCVKNIAELAL